MKRRRLRKWAKWACTIAAGAAVGVAVSSRFWVFHFADVARDRSAYSDIQVGEGLVHFIYHPRGKPGMIGMNSYWNFRRAGPWYWGLHDEMDSLVLAGDWQGGLQYSSTASDWYIGFSLLYPPLLTLIPAALLWYTDRRRSRPGACGGCGYDRAGLAAAVKCPECGTVPSISPVP